MVAWYPAEPERVGEVAFLPQATAVLGRHKPGHHYGTLPLLRFAALRPSAKADAHALIGLSANISKSQVELRATSEHIELAATGKAPMQVSGEDGLRPLVPGDTLAIGDELLLLCVRRPPLPPVEPAHSFAQADRDGIVGESFAAWRLREQIEHRGSFDDHVLILGPTGSGKELVARALHGKSARAGRAFVAVNAAALPDAVLESELFGYVRGAFTGADRDKPGAIQEAEGGTLFLDEIAELPPTSQAKLLRFLESREVRRVGDTRARTVDVRVIAATWQPLDKLRSDIRGRFRLQLAVPGLAERRDDIPLVAAAFAIEQKWAPTFSMELMDALIRHEYTQGIRELQRLLFLAMHPKRAGLNLTDEVRTELRFGDRDQGPTERDRLFATLERHDWDLDKVEKDLGISGKELARLRKTYGLETRVGQAITADLVLRFLESAGNDAKVAQRQLGISRDAMRNWMLKLNL